MPTLPISLSIFAALALVVRSIASFMVADDLLMLLLIRSGLQSMIDTCQLFAIRISLKVSMYSNPIISKTKGIIFRQNEEETEYPEI